MSFQSFFKTIIKTSALTSLGITSSITLAPEIKAENFNMAACPEPGSTNANLTYIAGTLQGQCLHTPDQYILTIYEMGLCTSDPTAAAHFDKTNCVETMISTAGTEVDLAPGTAASKTAALPAAPRVYRHHSTAAMSPDNSPHDNSPESKVYCDHPTQM